VRRAIEEVITHPSVA
ncbi:TPA_asm: UL51 uORF, partial [Human alphaherpesvirus 1]